MIGDGAPRPRFAVGMRGYDRAQVDAYIADGARWATQAWARIMDLEAQVSELECSEASERLQTNVDRAIESGQATVDRFVDKVDTKAAELEGAVMKAAQPQVDELRRQVEELEDQRQSALDELARLRQTVLGFRGDLGLVDESMSPESNGLGRERREPPPAMVVPKLGDQ
jgi:cell division septum initiation protein DivIVA